MHYTIFLYYYYRNLDDISVKIWNKIILRVFYILINKLQTKRNWPTTWSVLFDSNYIGLFDIFSFFFFFSSWLKSLHSDRQKDVYLHIVSSFDNVLYFLMKFRRPLSFEFFFNIKIGKWVNNVRLRSTKYMQLNVPRFILMIWKNFENRFSEMSSVE